MKSRFPYTVKVLTSTQIGRNMSHAKFLWKLPLMDLTSTCCSVRPLCSAFAIIDARLTNEYVPSTQKGTSYVLWQSTKYLGWLGSLVVRALDLQLNGREFDSRPPNYRVVILGWVTVFGGHATSVCNQPPRQLSLLPPVRREMSTSQSTVMHCGWGVKAGWF